MYKISDYDVIYDIMINNPWKLHRNFHQISTENSMKFLTFNSSQIFNLIFRHILHVWRLNIEILIELCIFDFSVIQRCDRADVSLFYYGIVVFVVPFSCQFSRQKFRDVKNLVITNWIFWEFFQAIKNEGSVIEIMIKKIEISQKIPQKLTLSPRLCVLRSCSDWKHRRHHCQHPGSIPPPSPSFFLSDVWRVSLDRPSAPHRHVFPAEISAIFRWKVLEISLKNSDFSFVNQKLWVKIQLNKQGVYEKLVEISVNFRWNFWPWRHWGSPPLAVPSWTRRAGPPEFSQKIPHISRQDHFCSMKIITRVWFWRENWKSRDIITHL